LNTTELDRTTTYSRIVDDWLIGKDLEQIHLLIVELLAARTEVFLCKIRNVIPSEIFQKGFTLSSTELVRSTVRSQLCSD
jgi:hypothetical protein